MINFDTLYLGYHIQYLFLVLCAICQKLRQFKPNVYITETLHLSLVHYTAHIALKWVKRPVPVFYVPVFLPCSELHG